MHTRAARLARGWVIGVVATALAALSHAVAGGDTPSPLALAVGVVFGGMLGTLAIGRRPSLPRLTVAVAGTQLAFHGLFSLLSTTGQVSGAAAHGHAGGTVITSTSGAAHVTSPEMLLAHAVAGALTLALLQGAERAAWRLLTEFARLVIAPFRAVPAASPPDARPPVPRPHQSPAPLLGRILTTSVSRRGPPVAVAF